MSGTTSNTTSDRLTSIDVLRGSAALWVVVYHVFSSFVPQEGATPWQAAAASPVLLGYAGVHLFLVLSGFCIHLPLALRTRDGEALKLKQGPYWRRRARRLYPAYLAAIVFSVAFGFASAMWLANDYSAAFALQRARAISGDLLSHLTLTHLFFIDYAWSLNNPVFWSLALEAQLYLLYPLLLVMRNRMSLVKVLGCVLLVTLAWRGWATWVWSAGDWGGIPQQRVEMFVRLHAPARWFEWTLGFAAAEVYARGLTLPAWCRSWRVGAVLFVLGAVIEHSDAGRFLVDPLWGASFVVLLGAAIRREQVRPPVCSPGAKWLAAVGVISYSLYLIHAPIVRGVILLTYNFAVPFWPAMGIYLLTVPLCIAAAWLFFRWFERPFLRSTSAASQRDAGPRRIASQRLEKQAA